MKTQAPHRRAAPARVLATAVSIALLFPQAGWANARLEARRHFRSGMALINAGRYDEGIAELKEAYSIKPHPNVLYNIARAAVSAGRVSEAVHYYRRYLATHPRDAKAVREELRPLEASLAQTRRKRRPAPEPAPVDEVSGVEPAAGADPEAPIPSPSPAVVSEAPTEEEARWATDEGDEEGEETPYLETVVTASRRQQSTLEAPYSTTVITAEEIELSGATSLPELLRRVPGAEVTYLGVSSANLSFRGFNQRAANKVLVLIDGRPLYEDFMGITLWPTNPVGIEEIERIEVIRGPGSALYGANAMLGVVNIITRAPGSTPSALFRGTAGSGNTYAGSFVASGGQALRYRASVGYEQANKWSRDFASDRADIASLSFDPHLGLRKARGNLSALYQPSRKVTAGVSGGVARVYSEFYPPGILRNFFLEGVSAYAQSHFHAGPLRVKGFWNHLDLVNAPQYSPVGQRVLANHLSSNVFDLEALVGHELELVGKHRLDFGLTARVKQIDWELVSGRRSELHLGALVQEEWRIAQPVRLVASYRVDRHPLLDGGKPGFAHSPRVSALFSPHEGHALRATFATAFREPTFLESYIELRTPVPGVNGSSVLTTGDTALKPERLTAFELGYRGESQKLALDWELTGYLNHVNDLIVISAIQPLPASEAFDAKTQTFLLGRSRFQNESAEYVARGVELGGRYTPVHRLDLSLSGSLQSVTSASAAACGPCTQAPAFKVFGSVGYRAPQGWELSADAAYTSSTTWIEREPSPADPTQISYLRNALPGYVVVNARMGYRWQERATFALIGTQLGPAHAEHPFGNAIERRFLLTATVTP